MADDVGGAGTDRWDVVADSYGSSAIIVRLATALIELVAISPGESVLDVGTGTGLALIPAAKAAGTGTAVGVDRSLGMLRVAASRLTEAHVNRPGIGDCSFL